MFVVIYFVLLLLLVCLLDYSPDPMVCPPEIPPLTLLSGGHVVVVLPHKVSYRSAFTS
jgi:hypothetical protein